MNILHKSEVVPAADTENKFLAEVSYCNLHKPDEGEFKIINDRSMQFPNSSFPNVSPDEWISHFVQRHLDDHAIINLPPCTPVTKKTLLNQVKIINQ